LLYPVRVRRLSFLLGLLGVAAAPVLAQPVCPDDATVTVVAENLSAAPTIDVTVDGALVADAATCTGSGATSYHAVLTCAGAGTVRCGRVEALRPGAWVHRITLAVPGSDPQHQTQRTMVVAGRPADVSNTIAWTIYPRTFVVSNTNGDASPGSLPTALAAAMDSSGPALVTFALPAGSAIDLARDPCLPDSTVHAAVCFRGSHVVVDALDENATPGAVTWSVGARDLSVLRLYGSDDVFRGITFVGSTRNACPAGQTSCMGQVDTVTVTGAGARRNRFEQCDIVGPTYIPGLPSPNRGDALSVDDGAGQPDADGPGDNVVIDSRVRRAADKGVKVDFDAYATIARTCIHDNRNGGIQSTLGGHVVALENVVQYNVPGSAQNGISVRGTDALRSTLATEGNVVRFSGGRGLSVTGNAAATFRSDYSAGNQFKGSVVETAVKDCCAPPGETPDADCVPTSPCPDGTEPHAVELVPSADFRGVALVCNHMKNLTGTCRPSTGDPDTPCTTVQDCCVRVDGTFDEACVATTQCGAGSFPTGVGAVTSTPVGHTAPDVTYGDDVEPGRNAFTANRNAPAGANFQMKNVVTTVPAGGDQWESCPDGPPCDVTPDVAPPGAPVAVDPVANPHAAADFALVRVSPPRPRAGDVVRVYGTGFDAIAGNPTTNDCIALPACVTDGTCACSIEDPAVQLRNRQTNANRIRIRLNGVPLCYVGTDAAQHCMIEPDAVTPTMLAFRMPFDCFAPLTLDVAKHVGSIRLCDPHGCADAPAGAPCDDGSVCTTDDRCDGAGSCVGGAPVACDGPCQACDPVAGCGLLPATATCDDGDACTVGDHCAGDANACVPGGPSACTGACLSGACDPQRGCVPHPAGTVCRRAAGPCDAAETCDGSHAACPPDAFAPVTAACDDGDACTAGDHCGGATAACVPGAPLACAGACFTGQCDPLTGCQLQEGLRVLTCRIDECPKPRLHRRLAKVGFRIDHALDVGARPKDHAVRRLSRLLARCGVVTPLPR